jgi:protoporphyrinogen IX oxidase
MSCRQSKKQISITWRKAFAEDRNKRPARFYRLMNEVPAVMMVVIVVMVIVKPF